MSTFATAAMSLAIAGLIVLAAGALLTLAKAWKTRATPIREARWVVRGFGVAALGFAGMILGVPTSAVSPIATLLAAGSVALVGLAFLVWSTRLRAST